MNETTTAHQYPYSSNEIRDMFNIQEATLKNLVQVLRLTPTMNVDTQELRFSDEDFNRLRFAVDQHRQGKPLSEIIQLINVQNNVALAKEDTPSETHGISIFNKDAAKQQEASLDGTGIASVVEAIGHSKDFILNEMSRLLDDRLSGLDEVVVELIRTKSENDSLRNQINSLNKQLDESRQEVASFKPVQFGFYKKMK